MIRREGGREGGRKGKRVSESVNWSYAIKHHKYVICIRVYTRNTTCTMYMYSTYIHANVKDVIYTRIHTAKSNCCGTSPNCAQNAVTFLDIADLCSVSSLRGASLS